MLNRDLLGRLAEGLDRLDRRQLVDGHEPAVAGGIGADERGAPPLDGGHHHPGTSGGATVCSFLQRVPGGNTTRPPNHPAACASVQAMRVPVLMLLAVAVLAACGAASAHSSRLHDSHACPGATGYTCATLDVPLDHAHPGRGTLHLQVGMGDNVARAARSAARALGRAGTARAADHPRLRLQGARGRAAPVPHRACSTSAGRAPARSTARRCSTQMGSSGPHAADGLRRPVVRPQAGSAASVLRHRRHRRRHGGLCARRSASTSGRSTGSRTARTSASATGWPIRHTSRSSCSTRSCRRWGRPTSASMEFAAVRRVFHSVCGARLPGRPRDRRAARPPRAAAARRADVRQHRRPDVPQVLERAGGAPRGEPRQPEAARTPSSPPPRASSGTRPTCSTRACTRARSAPTGVIPGEPRRRRSRAAPRSSEPPSRGFRPAKLYPFDRQTASGNGFVQQCLPWAPTPPTPSAARQAAACRRCSSNGNHDLSTPARLGAAAARPDPAREAGRRPRRRPLGAVARGERCRPDGRGALPARLTRPAATSLRSGERKGGADGGSVRMAAALVLVALTALAEQLDVVVGRRTRVSLAGPFLVAAALVGGPLVGACAGASTEAFTTGDALAKARLCARSPAQLQGLAIGLVGQQLSQRRRLRSRWSRRPSDLVTGFALNARVAAARTRPAASGCASELRAAWRPLVVSLVPARAAARRLPLPLRDGAGPRSRVRRRPAARRRRGRTGSAAASS